MNTRRTNRFALTFLVLGLATTAVAAVGTGDTREHDVTVASSGSPTQEETT